MISQGGIDIDLNVIALSYVGAFPRSALDRSHLVRTAMYLATAAYSCYASEAATEDAAEFIFVL